MLHALVTLACVAFLAVTLLPPKAAFFVLGAIGLLVLLNLLQATVS